MSERPTLLRYIGDAEFRARVDRVVDVAVAAIERADQYYADDQEVAAIYRYGGLPKRTLSDYRRRQLRDSLINGSDDGLRLLEG